jgi:hypothetical protein
MAPKKGMTTNFFSPLSFNAVFGTEFQDPGWVKIRIRDKNPGSATLKKQWIPNPDPKHFTEQIEVGIWFFKFLIS